MTRASHVRVHHQVYGLSNPKSFGIYRQESEAKEPQQRILLEAVCEIIESAGYSFEKFQSPSIEVSIVRYFRT